jgi:FixJ family two-component response regulator
MTTRGTVHVVDDDASLRTSLARLLGGAGYDVVPYESAEALLAVAGPHLAGCILLDLRLPGATGLDAQRALRDCACRLPIIFLTAHGELTAGVRAMKHGAVDFLEKPVAPDTLLLVIAEAMTRAADERHDREELETLRALAARLSARERDVWLRVARGQLNKQIAADLGIVERTVKLHRAAAMTKLCVQSTAELARAAERLGLIDHRSAQPSPKGS